MERWLLKKPQKKGKIRQIMFLNLFRSLEYLFVVFPFFSKIKGVEGKLELPCGKEVESWVLQMKPYVLVLTIVAKKK